MVVKHVEVGQQAISCNEGARQLCRKTMVKGDLPVRRPTQDQVKPSSASDVPLLMAYLGQSLLINEWPHRLGSFEVLFQAHPDSALAMVPLWVQVRPPAHG